MTEQLLLRGGRFSLRRSTRKEEVEKPADTKPVKFNQWMENQKAPERTQESTTEELIIPVWIADPCRVRQPTKTDGLRVRDEYAEKRQRVYSR